MDREAVDEAGTGVDGGCVGIGGDLILLGGLYSEPLWELIDAGVIEWEFHEGAVTGLVEDQNAGPGLVGYQAEVESIILADRAQADIIAPGLDGDALLFPERPHDGCAGVVAIPVPAFDGAIRFLDVEHAVDIGVDPVGNPGAIRFAIEQVERAFNRIGDAIRTLTLPGEFPVMVFQIGQGQPGRLAIRLFPVEQIDGIEPIIVVAPVVMDSGVEDGAGAWIDGLVHEAVFVAAVFEDIIQHGLDRLTIGAGFGRAGRVAGGVNLGQAGDEFAVMIAQAQFGKVAGGVVIAQQVVIGDAAGHIEIASIAGIEIEAAEDLHHFTVDFDVIGREPAEGGLERGLVEDAVDDGGHALGPGGGAEPFGNGHEAVLNVFGAIEDQAVEAFLFVAVFPGIEVVLRGQAVGLGGDTGFGMENVEHAALIQGAVGQGGGQDHKCVVVGGGVFAVPEVLVAGQIARNQAGCGIGVAEPAIHIFAAAAQGFVGLTAVDERAAGDGELIILEFTRPEFQLSGRWAGELDQVGIGGRQFTIRRGIGCGQPDSGQEGGFGLVGLEGDLVVFCIGGSGGELDPLPLEVVVVAGFNGNGRSVVDDKDGRALIIFGAPKQIEYIVGSGFDGNGQVERAVAEKVVRCAQVFLVIRSVEPEPGGGLGPEVAG